MIVLDTHTLIWWVNGDQQLSAKARKAIEAELSGEGRVIISAISACPIDLPVPRVSITF